MRHLIIIAALLLASCATGDPYPSPDAGSADAGPCAACYAAHSAHGCRYGTCDAKNACVWVWESIVPDGTACESPAGDGTCVAAKCCTGSICY